MFKPGQSGNPKGRPRKTNIDEALRASIKSACPEIIAGLIRVAKEGDVQAARALLGYALPPLKAQDGPIRLDLGHDLASAMMALRTALAGGELTPGAANAVASIVATEARIAETAQLEQRLTAVEAQLAQPNE